MNVDINTWREHDPLVFEDRHFDRVDLHEARKEPGPDETDVNTELRFHNCTIGTFSAETLFLGKKVTFSNCRIGFLSCYATYFLGGLDIEDCHIEKESSFSAGAHNQDPHAFTISRSTFEEYVDFFDVWFLGPVKITDNHFKQGTNLAIYLTVPAGIPEGMSCEVNGNTGDLHKRKQDEPHIGR